MKLIMFRLRKAEHDEQDKQEFCGKRKRIRFVIIHFSRGLLGKGERGKLSKIMVISTEGNTQLDNLELLWLISV